MRRRLILDVRPEPTELGTKWSVIMRGYGRRAGWATKKAAILDARMEAHDHVSFGGLAQIVVWKRTNRGVVVQTEWTYDNDPRPTASGRNRG